MGLFRFFKHKENKSFVSEVAYITNRGKQSHKVVEILVELRELNIEEVDVLPIQFFFQTDALDKATLLAKELEHINYIGTPQITAQKKDLYLITGSTSGIKMVHEIIRNWTMELCDVGFKHDCDFTHWEIQYASNLN
jgi:hypothetical protein